MVQHPETKCICNSVRRFEQSRNTKCHNEEAHNALKNEKTDMLCQEEFMFSLLACKVLFILDFNMQQLTLQTNLAPPLKSAWHKSAFSGMEWVVLKNGVDSLFSGIIWSKEIGHWNDLTLKGIENHKLDARNVQGPPTECTTIRSNSSWPKRIETWRLLVLLIWMRKVLSRFQATARRPWSMQITF